MTNDLPHLSATEEGRRLIKSARLELRSINAADIEEIVGRIVGCAVLRSYYDLDVEAEPIWEKRPQRPVGKA